jgi:type I restriction-modification system DNA methylase subunit
MVQTKLASFPSYHNRGLFSQHYLANRLPLTALWQIDDTMLKQVFEDLKSCYENFAGANRLNEINEAQTEDEFIRPVLDILGYSYRVQTALKRQGRVNFPDYTLFVDDEQKKKANLLADKQEQFYKHALAICEAKYWERPLDKKIPNSARDTQTNANPSFQIIDYLVRSNVDFGILTNGRLWRLYYQKADSRSSSFYEVDLVELLESDDLEQFKYFLFFFHRQAFIKDQTQRNFLEYVISESTSYAIEVGEKLKEYIFEEIFVDLANGFAKHEIETGCQLQDIDLKRIFDNTLVLLYRLLFLLYAEGRSLLPIDDTSGYYSYSMLRLRHEIAQRVDSGQNLSTISTDIWNDLRSLFRIVNYGDPNLHVPPYNGGLFSEELYPYLASAQVADSYIIPVLEKLSRLHSDSCEHPMLVDYSSLGVRHLGSIYEGLLEFTLQFASTDLVAIRKDGKEIIIPKSEARATNPIATIPKGTLYLVNDKSERKSTGSYYTPDFIVKYIVANTVTPLIDNIESKRANLEKQLLRGAKYKQYTKKRKQIYLDENADVPMQILDLKICDPAMGSGHFLVEAVDVLSDAIVVLLDKYPESKLHRKIDDIRAEIVTSLKEKRISIDEEKLTDTNIVRRMVMKRCVYGVDLNPLAVELAKLSLWLHCFTIGAPLSFLDHHLKCGNSLIGASLKQVRDTLSPTLFGGHFIGLLSATELMQQVGELTDSTLSQIEQSKTHYQEAADTLAPYKRIFNIWCTDFFYTEIRNRRTTHPMRALLEHSGDIESMVKNLDHLQTGDKKLVDVASNIAAERRYFHWELEFPEVFFDRGIERTSPGFDAVVGNPPWERIKLQELEFFATRDISIATAPTTAERRQKIDALQNKNPRLYREYRTALDTSDREMEYLRSSGSYELSSSGDINYYLVFTERAHRIRRTAGMMGYVIPSGIYADKTSSNLFSSFVDGGELYKLIDFENQGTFPYVHRSFKYTILVLSGLQDASNTFETAFFLHTAKDLDNPDNKITLSSADLLRMNPNTKTCPIFRTQRDADLVRNIYSCIPILVEHTEHGDINAWGIKYFRMFDMTNDSNKFVTADALEGQGYWLSAGNIYRKGDETFLPLYEAKMIHQYDHRYACAIPSETRLQNTQASEVVGEGEKCNNLFSVTPRFYVSSADIRLVLDSSTVNSQYFLGFRDIARTTDSRTFISTMIPFVGAGNNLPLLLVSHSHLTPCLLANFNSLIFDYIARQKVGGTHLNWFIVEQLPVLEPDRFSEVLHGVAVMDLVIPRVLELVYTANDIKAFAEDLGYKKKPFKWDEERRLHLKCQLDALFFILYKIKVEDIDYILDTYPIVQRQDQERYGKYRTKELILEYVRAFKAGNFDAWSAK